MDRRALSKAFFLTAAGAALLPGRASAQTCTPPCYPVTTPESNAGVTPTDLSREPSPIDPRRYGFAAGASAATNTAALNNALEVSRSGGGEVLIRENGTYTCNRITMLPGATLRGAGWTTVLRLANGANDHLISWNEVNPADDSGIYDIRLDGNKAANTTGAGIVLTGQRIRISNVQIRDTVLAGILIQGLGTTTSDDCVIERCLVSNPGKNGNGWGGIAATSVSNIRITQNIVRSDDGEMTYGIDIEPNAGEIASQIVIDENSVVGGRIFVDSANTTSISRLLFAKIHGNYVDARGSAGTGQANGAPIFVRYTTYLDVSGNTCIGDANTVSPYSPYGGVVLDACTNFSIHGNTFIVTAVTGDEYAVFFSHDIAANATGSIQGNTFINAGAGTCRYAIYAQGSDVTALEVGRNTLLGSWASDAINLTDANSSAAPTIETTRRVTVDFSTGGSLAAGASRSVLLTSGFACTPGDEVKACVVSGSIGSNSWQIFADVTNVNVVCLTLINRDSASVTPGSAIDVRLILRRYRLGGTAH